MSAKEEGKQTDSEEEQDEHEAKVTISEKYRKDAKIFKDMMNQLIEETASQFDPKMIANGEGQKAKIKFKNMIIEHCNSVLRAYKQHTVIVPQDQITPKDRNSNVHIKHKNKPLEKQSELIKQLYFKSLQCNKATVAQKIDIQIEVKYPQQFYVLHQKEKVPVSELLPELDFDDIERRNNIIIKRENRCIKLHHKLIQKIQKENDEWDRQYGIQHKNNDRSKTKSKDKNNHIFEPDAFNDLSFN